LGSHGEEDRGLPNGSKEESLNEVEKICSRMKSLRGGTEGRVKKRSGPGSRRIKKGVWGRLSSLGNAGLETKG